MAAGRATSSVLFRGIFRPTTSLLRARFFQAPPQRRTFASSPFLVLRTISYSPVLCKAYEGSDGDGKKAPARMAQVQQLIYEATERAQAAGNEAIPKITIDHVTVNFARSGGPGGQNVNKVNTKVDTRFNVQNAHWLSGRVREKIMQTEKNRINRDGELVISSTKTRTQKGNIEDALSKLQAIIDAASYVPPPPSEQQVKKIAKLAAAGERKRLEGSFAEEVYEKKQGWLGLILEVQ